jgi:hypothetical protein
MVRKSPDQVSIAVTRGGSSPGSGAIDGWLAMEFEATIDSARAFLYAASVMLLVRRIAGASRLSKPTLTGRSC